MALVFAATILAGSLGAIHFVVVHMIMGKPFSDEEERIAPRDPGARTADGRPDPAGGRDTGRKRDG